jgi:hypothetical protein
MSSTSNLPRVTALAAALFLPVHATQKLYAEFHRILERSRSLSSLRAQKRLRIKRLLKLPKFIVLLLSQSDQHTLQLSSNASAKIAHWVGDKSYTTHHPCIARSRRFPSGSRTLYSASWSFGIGVRSEEAPAFFRLPCKSSRSSTSKPRT